ncbi:tetratricopeptide repeat protein [Treponema parvum]|nr:tetratricopeptide repeat protein [Treponema parvum]
MNMQNADGGDYVLPEKNTIKNVYEKYTPLLSAIVKNIEQSLKDTLSLRSNPTYKSRIKTFASYYRKILRVKKRQEFANDDVLICVSDIMGIRVICAFLEDLSVVERQIKENYVVKEVEHKGNPNNFKEFGYESVHILIEIPPSCVPVMLPGCAYLSEPDRLIVSDKAAASDQPSGKPSDDVKEVAPLKIPKDLVCEIQVRTILQDAWAEVEHELIYKSEFSPTDIPLRRKLASMNASLSLADIIFQEIRDYQNKLQREMDQRRQTFYFKADKLTHEEGDKETYLNKNIERISPFVRGTIDDLILEALHAHNTGDLDRAVEIYTAILTSDPKPPPAVLTVIYKHRGMAYFSKNDFEKALSDFKSSFDHDSKNYRALYYQGIVHMIKDDYKESAECFSASLAINEYQSHAFYRRAWAYYKMNEYGKSLLDLTNAERLGLDNGDCKTLHKKLMDKLDMGM